MRCEPGEPNVTVEQERPPLDLPEGVPPLGSFYLYMTTGCNLACRHCWITPTFVDGEPSPGDCLDVDLLREAVAEAKPMGLSQAKLTGGEPTLHPRFVEIADMLTAEGLRLDMETNGTLMDANLAKHLKEETSLWFVSVSLDGATAETHDWFRGVPGAFDAALRGLAHLVDAGYENVQVIMCPHHGNIGELEDLVKLAVERGAGSVKFNPVTRSGRGIAMHERGEALDYDEVLALARYVRGELQDRTPIPLKIATPPALSTVGELLRTRDGGGSCHVRHILGILGTGEMALCGIGRNVPELCFGRLGQDSVREVWSTHPALLQLRRDLDDTYPGICGECIHARRCLTHCVAQNYLDSGHLVWPSALCAEAERRELFPASRRRRMTARAEEKAIHAPA
jgi:SynChlorMet cassette radical SAM/SPASM protein ScmF